MEVLNRIEELRKERGWSIYKLAEESGITQSTLANMFSRKTMPSISTLTQLCAAFDISLSQFFNFNSTNFSDEEFSIISKYRKDIKSDILNNFISKLKDLNKNIYYLNYMECYTPCKEFLEEFDKQPFVNLSKKNIVITGPGGGSGKFAFCLSQLYNEMKNGNIPQYIKYESFPVHNLELTHPVNLAYMSATIDLKDVILEDKYKSGSISYNRDLENFELLKFIANNFDKESYFLKKLKSPTDMGINFIKEGIVDNCIVKEAASIEVFRRFLICKRNYLNNNKNKEYVKNIQKILDYIINN